jgi:hypothetical protein
MNPNDDLSSLGYVSSAPSLVEVDSARPRDEADLSTLEDILNLLKDRKKYYTNVDSLSLTDNKFTIDQQLAINKKVAFHIQELETMLSSAIRKVREKQNGRG